MDALTTTRPEARAWRTLPRLDRLGVLSALVGGTTLAWIYLFRLADGMTGASIPMAAIQIRPWGAADFILIFLMWTIMMVGMMVPSAAPAVMIYAAIARKAARDRTVVPPTVVFLSGYLALWTAFSLVATLAQWGLDQARVVVPHDGDYESFDRIRSPDRGGRVPSHAGQTRLLETLPVASTLPGRALAHRNHRGVSDGAGARVLLFGMLLGIDGTPVRGWRDEPALDRGHRDVRICREGDSSARFTGAGSADGWSHDSGWTDPGGDLGGGGRIESA